jgi:hypothetical protein
MTGTFYYTPKERLEIENMIQEKNSTVGIVKFKEVLNDVSAEQKKYLLNDGINCEEISNIFTLPEFNKENEFKSKETRKLAEPNIIEVDINDNFDYDSMLLNLNERKLSSGYLLTPDETAENLGILLNFEKINIEDEKKELKIPIRKHFLKFRERKKVATSEEIAELKQIESNEIAHKISLLRNEIKKAGIGKKNFEKIRPQIEQITPFLLRFNEKRLTSAKFPVWLDFERFLHIFLRHVNEVNFGGNFEDKTKFQYLIDDILRLIEIVIDSIEDEIQKHFAGNTGKNFKRHGEMAVYFKGDYYAIAINPEGLLMTFYKRE